VTQLLAQTKLGREINSNNNLLQLAFETIEKKRCHHPFFPMPSFFVMKTTQWLALVVQAMKVPLAKGNTALNFTPRLGRC
jgi:hypothetical protein